MTECRQTVYSQRGVSVDRILDVESSTRVKSRVVAFHWADT